MSEHARMFIDGEWVDSESGAVLEALSPSTGKVIGTVPEGTRADVQRAVDAAARAWPAWAAMSAFDRAAAMERVANELLLEMSGVGRVGGRFSMDRLTELKTIVIDLG